MEGQKAITLDVGQVDAAFHASLSPPAFRFAERWSDFQAALFRRLAPFGLRLHDIKVETPSANPADFSVACWIFGLSAVVRYRFDRVEVWTNRLPLLLDLDRATDVVVAATGVATDLEIGTSIVTKGVVISLHVRPPVSFVETLLATLIPQPPPGTPALRPSGLALTSETVEPRTSVVLEPSTQLSGGLFMRFASEHGAGKLERTIISEASAFIEDFTQRIGINLRWPEQ